MRGAGFGILRGGLALLMAAVLTVPVVAQTVPAAPRLILPGAGDPPAAQEPQPTPADQPAAMKIPATMGDPLPIASPLTPSTAEPSLSMPIEPAAEKTAPKTETKLESGGAMPSPLVLPEAAPKAAEEPLRPIAEPSPTGLAKLEAASFNGITPGVTTAEEVEKTWGLPKEIKKQDGLLTHRFAVEPFDRVEVTYVDNKVSALVIRFGKAFPADGVAQQLELSDVRPVLVSNELGEVLGQAYPERGVLFAFEPSQGGKPTMQVLQIILEPLSAEPFVLRAETHLESQTKASLLDLEQALKLEPKNGRALWLYGRVLATSGELEKAAASLAEAIAITPDNPHYRVSRAQVLGQLGKLVEAMQEAQKAAELAKNRPHVRARALCLLGDLSASGPKPDYRQALNLHTESINVADELTDDKHPAVRLAAKEVLVDAHLGAAHDIAWGDWKEKEDRVPRWLERAASAADDLISSEGAGEEQRFRVCTRALAACVGVRGGCDPSVWTRAALHIGQKLIDDCKDPLRKAQLQWDLGIALYDALQVFQMRGDHASALKYGEHAITYLGNSETKPSPAMAYLLGRLYFRLGAVHSLREHDHKAAVAWFNKAIPLLEKPLPPEAAADAGRHGETFVSMGVSYWEIGQREQAVELTGKGVKLMEQAAKQGLIDEAAMAVPYGNLSAMHAKMGASDTAKRYQTMATRARSMK